mmetsp:Transcript_38980/g.103018  ORF Transcript_38980/g.103018 Transcript_38980/m.103018 type:complete len:256 (-) Transcript_38980:58-825(-)
MGIRLKLLAEGHLRGLVHQGRLLERQALLRGHRLDGQAFAERDHLALNMLLTRDWPGYCRSADASSLQRLLLRPLHGHGLHAREQLLERRLVCRPPGSPQAHRSRGDIRGSLPGAHASLERQALEFRPVRHRAHLLLVVGVAAIRILARAGADKRLAELRASKVRQRIQLFLLVSKLASAPLGAHAQDVELAHLGLGEDHCPRSTFTLGNLSRRTGRRHRLSLRTVPTSLAARHCCCCKGRGRTQSGACGRKAPS